MNEDLSDIKYSPIRDYNCAQYFESLNYNGRTLTEKERNELVTFIDETVSQHSSGLPLIQDILESSRNQQDEYHVIKNTVASVMLFLTLTMTDCLTASKYFLIADNDYDRRFMRGKMMVILNEGFKRLYGFDARTQKKSEWNKLKPFMSYFAPIIQTQYEELTSRLDQHARSSSWWKDERNLETHLDAERLYLSRQEEVIESKVMMDNSKLYGTLLAAFVFLMNVHACQQNFLVSKCKRG